MSLTNLGDLSHSFTSRQRNVSLREEIGRLTEELATGQVADVRNVLAGNYSTLTDIERSIATLGGYSVATSEATIFANNTQLALGNLQDFSADLSNSLLFTGTSSANASLTDVVAEARNALGGILGNLNTNVAGRYLFSGTATDQPPLPDMDTILTALSAEVAGFATPNDVLLAAESWFDDPAGFDAAMYQGSANGIGPFALSKDETVGFDIRAIDPKLKEIIKFAAVAALADDPALGFTHQNQTDLFFQSGEGLLRAQDSITSLRANVGFVEGRIDGIATRNAAELTSLQFLKTDLLEVDPFETATKLEEAQFQLQSLYSVTVRMSQLSLANFL